MSRGTHFLTDEVPFGASASAGTEFAVSHNLRNGDIATIPKGYIILQQTGAGSLYPSGTTWTSSTIYLKSDGASFSGTLLLF